jgi:hypothetical protein
MAPDELGLLIEGKILRERRAFNRIVERPRLAAALPDDGHAVQALMAVTALPRFVWHILASLTPPERLAWLGWIVLLAVLSTTARAPRPS